MREVRGKEEPALKQTFNSINRPVAEGQRLNYGARFSVSRLNDGLGCEFIF